jgi:hypothetical protein
MYTTKLIFAQVLEHLPQHTLRRCVARYGANQHVKCFTCQDQFRCLAFAQLTYRESLRDIEACVRAQRDKLNHMGIRATVSRSTLADATERRDWRIYADLAQTLIHLARKLDVGEDFGIDLDNTPSRVDACCAYASSLSLSSAISFVYFGWKSPVWARITSERR